MPTDLPDSRRSPRFAGLVTFGRYPRLDDLDHDPDWTVYGVPFDGGVTYRPGARFGPRAIRDASQYLKRYSVEHDVDVCESLSLADAGDAPVSPYSIQRTLDEAAAWAGSLGGPSTRLLALGGDHSIALANMRASHAKHGAGAPLAVVHFDSHLDTVDEVWDERLSHASPFRRAIEEGVIDPSRMISIGIKGPLNARSDLDYARGVGIDVVTYPDWQTGGEGRLRSFVERVGDAPCYVSFDIDVVDPAFAPGTGTPSIGGFTSAGVLAALRGLRGLHIVGADVVEVLPDRDPVGITSLLAGHVAFEILAASVSRSSGS
ncbi:MAG: agmatinase [Planctomycetota bacterium]